MEFIRFCKDLPFELKQIILATAIQQICETRKWVLGESITYTPKLRTIPGMYELDFFNWCLHLFSSKPRVKIFFMDQERIFCVFWITDEIYINVPLTLKVPSCPLFLGVFKKCRVDLISIFVIMSRVKIYLDKFISGIIELDPKIVEMKAKIDDSAHLETIGLVRATTRNLENLNKSVNRLICCGRSDILLLIYNFSMFHKLSYVEIIVAEEFDLTEIKFILQSSQIRVVRITSTKSIPFSFTSDSMPLMKKFESKIDLRVSFVKDTLTANYALKSSKTNSALFTWIPRTNFISTLKVEHVFLELSLENFHFENTFILSLYLTGPSYAGTCFTGLKSLESLSFSSLNCSNSCLFKHVAYSPSLILNSLAVGTLPNSLKALNIAKVTIDFSPPEQDSQHEQLDIDTERLLRLPDSLEYLHCSVLQLSILDVLGLKKLKFISLELCDTIDESHSCWNNLPVNLQRLRLTGTLPVHIPNGKSKVPKLGGMLIPFTIKSEVLTIEFDKLIPVGSSSEYRLSYVYCNIDKADKRAKRITKAESDNKLKKFHSLYFTIAIKCPETQVHVFGDQLTLFSALKDKYPCEGYELSRVSGKSFVEYTNLEEKLKDDWIYPDELS
ncbi:unnamed protein product [Ambrosiozyma monospora]|uniref:Unnamed protein product n=1 Tax=Ambrosiozyma monospora TaxID=43982 RepID=A0A9W6YTV9_AMBMO|nr:unnamed protein product [Ambrosiozyma monospora]